MNTELLEKVKEQIMLEPKLLNMGRWEGEVNWETNSVTEKNMCNTAHCICGWAAVIKHKKPFYEAMREMNFDTEWDSESEFGQELLDLPNTDLFYVDKWPPRFQKKYQNYKQPLRRARVACEVIDDYIKTGGWEDE